MTNERRAVYEFAEFQFDPQRARLWRNGEPILLPPKSLAVLLVLLQKPGQVVERDELLRAVWGDTFIEDANLTVAISTLRKALHHNGDHPLIETVPRLGYCFTATVRQSGQTSLQPRIPVSINSPHLVGRKKELALLGDGLASARNGRGLLLCVAGEPGIGKTTLVENFLTSLAPDEACIARGRCAERLAGTEAYLPVLEILGALWQQSDETARLLSEVAPAWYAQIAPSAPRSAMVSQERLKRELLAFFQAITRAQPLVLFFDDLHWADVSTVDALAYLAANFAVLPVLIVVTYRPTELLLAQHPFALLKPDLQARGLCRELNPGFLSGAEVEAYLALEFAPHTFPAAFPQLLHAKTEGSPLFLVDLVRHLRDGGALTKEADSWRLTNTLPAIEHTLPESVRGMIEYKIAQLSEEECLLLTSASVQGAEFDSATLSSILKLAPDEVEAGLERLEHVFAFVRFIGEEEFPNRTLTSRYRFVHILYQNALYARLRTTQRVTLSAAMAQTLLDFYDAQSFRIATKLATLFEGAHDFAKATQYFVLSAQAAVQLNAHREAAELFQHGLLTLHKLPATPERDQQEIGLQLGLGVSLQSVQGWTAPAVNQAFNRARALCQPFKDDPNFFVALYGLALYHAIRAEYALARELVAQIFSLATKTNDPLLLTFAHFGRGAIELYQGELLLAQEHLEQAISYYQPSRHHDYLAFINEDVGVMAHRCLSQCLWLQGYADQALKTTAKALALAAQLSHPFSSGGAHQAAYLIHFFRRELDHCHPHFETTVALAQDYEQGTNLPFALLFQRLVRAHQNQSEAGMEQLQQNINEVIQRGERHSLTMLLTIMAELYEKQHEADKGLAEISKVEQFAEQTGEHWYAAEIWRVKGDLLVQKEAISVTTSAEACFQQAIVIARQQSAKAWELRATISLARLWQQQGKHEEARQILAEIYGRFTEGFDTTDLQDAKALLKELH